MPSVAPLVYPVPISTTLIKRNEVAAEYFDRRAQADLLARYPTSTLESALPPQEKRFVNRFCDPDHRVNNGSVFSLITGGTFDPLGNGRVQRAKQRAKKCGESELSDQELHDAFMGRVVRGRATGTPSRTFPVVGKMLKRDVLYLIIVNLPTEGERVQVMQALSEEE